MRLVYNSDIGERWDDPNKSMTTVSSGLSYIHDEMTMEQRMRRLLKKIKRKHNEMEQ